jgi:hypothetical protein
MNRDDITRMAKEAGWDSGLVMLVGNLEVFAALVAAAECEKVARRIIQKGYATGHGDTIEDLLTELEWQVAERERDACAKVCEWEAAKLEQFREVLAIAVCAAAIRARGEA